MADEAICIEKPNIYARYNVSDGFSISKGTLLMLSGVELYACPSAATANADVNQKFAGVAMEEKAANDGATEISAALDGVWDLSCANAAVTYGTHVVLSGANAIRSAVEASYPLGCVLGRALETAAAGETIRVRLGFM